jgi:hypothetical protein
MIFYRIDLLLNAYNTYYNNNFTITNIYEIYAFTNSLNNTIVEGILYYKYDGNWSGYFYAKFTYNKITHEYVWDITLSGPATQNNNSIPSYIFSELTACVFHTSSGGDPIIKPLLGKKFGLQNHIKFVNLLADYTNKIFINAHVDMLHKNNFPKHIYWNNSFSKTEDLNHIYLNSYYRKFHITCQKESIEIDADTLHVTCLTNVNKLRFVVFKPKSGLKSISFDKTYPLLDSTIGIKVGFGNYILTLITDINTDDRHYLELINLKGIDIKNTSGALISKDTIIRISDLYGSELYNYNHNPLNFYNYIDKNE